MEDVTVNPVSWIAWVVSLPIRSLTWIIATIKARTYDPEKDICPACGFRGDSGTGWKTCRIRVVRTTGPELASLQHICFRCDCHYHTTVFTPARKWLPPLEESVAAKVHAAASRTEL